MESILVFSLADVSTTCNTSGRYWQRASASPFSTSLRFSKSHLLPIGFSLLIVNVYYNLKKKNKWISPIKINNTCDEVYLRTSSTQCCKLKNVDLFVIS